MNVNVNMEDVRKKEKKKTKKKNREACGPMYVDVVCQEQKVSHPRFTKH